MSGQILKRTKGGSQKTGSLLSRYFQCSSCKISKNPRIYLVRYRSFR